MSLQQEFKSRLSSSAYSSYAATKQRTEYAINLKVTFKNILVSVDNLQCYLAVSCIDYAKVIFSPVGYPIQGQVLN